MCLYFFVYLGVVISAPFCAIRYIMEESLDMDGNVVHHTVVMVYAVMVN